MDMNPISGHSLLNAFSKLKSRLIPLVSNSPEFAIERAELIFGKKLTKSCTEIEDFTILRNYIFEYSPKIDYINALIITLPHTHWKKPEPIIYEFDEKGKRYIIGPIPIKEDEKYYPVSFLFYKGVALPYEWAAESVGIMDLEFYETIKIIEDVASKYIGDFYPLGLSINFRFKSSLFSEFGGTVEVPETDPASPNIEYSYILSQSNFNKSNEQFNLSQVAWYPFSDMQLQLSNNEEAVLKELRGIIESLKSEEDKFAFLMNIKNRISEK